MPELRKDPIVGRWVIVATERARRPGNIVESAAKSLWGKKENCPYCPAQKNVLFSKEDVQVIPYVKSFFKNDIDVHRHFHGIYEIVKGFGIHELVIETRDHVANTTQLSLKQIQTVLEIYALRMKAASQDNDVRHVLAYKNFGAVAGSEMTGHSCSHVIGMPVIPFHVKEKIDGACEYFTEHHRCTYCDLIGQELSAQTRIVLESKHFVVLTPFAARFLFEVWILPKKHSADFTENSQSLFQDLARILKQLLLKLEQGLDNPAYNFVIQTAPVRGFENGSLKDYYHWHIEVLPRLTRAAGFEKGTDFYINSIPPEVTAEYLKGIEVSS